MLEQVSFSSNGDHEQSTILQLSLESIDRAVESITELVSIRVRSMKTEDNETPSLRYVDPTILTTDLTVVVATEHVDKILKQR